MEISFFGRRNDKFLEFLDFEMSNQYPSILWLLSNNKYPYCRAHLPFLIWNHAKIKLGTDILSFFSYSISIHFIYFANQTNDVISHEKYYPFHSENKMIQSCFFFSAFIFVLSYNIPTDIQTFLFQLGTNQDFVSPLYSKKKKKKCISRNNVFVGLKNNNEGGFFVIRHY